MQVGIRSCLIRRCTSAGEEKVPAAGRQDLAILTCFRINFRPHIDQRVGVFISGSTEWKLNTMCRWGALTKEKNAYLHVGRVNTVRRIRRCQQAGADSFDGTSVTRFICNLPKLDAARRQTTIWGMQ